MNIEGSESSNKHANLGYAYFKKKDYINAINSLKDALTMSEKDKSKSEYNLVIAKSYYKLKMYDEAIKYAKDSISLEPNESNAYILLGKIYDLEKNDKGFDELVQLAQKYFPADPPVYYSKK